MNAYLKRAVVQGVFAGRQNIDVTFQSGVNCIHGVNGSGKTVFINLLMGALSCQTEYLSKVSFDSVEIYIQKKGNQRATKLFSVEVDLENIVHYTFHISLSPQYKTILSGGLSGHGYHYEPVKKGDVISFDLDDEEGYEDEIERIRLLIASTMATTYVPLLRGSKAPSRPLWASPHEEIEDPYVDMLNRLQQVFSRRYGSALSKVNRSLETMKSKIFEKLLFDDDLNSSVSVEVSDINKLVGSQDVNELEGVDKTSFFENIEKSTLPVSVSRLEKHFDIWTSIKQEVLDSYNNLQKVENSNPNEPSDIERAKDRYSKAFFKCLASIRFYRRFNEAVKELQVLQDKKNAELAPFKKFEKMMNEFLATGKVFSLTTSGGFQLKFYDEDLRFKDLSSGEKHILAILARVCLSAFTKSTLFVADEPELSLHLEWQRMIIPSIKAVSPNMQVVVATHSPAIITDDANMIDILECYSNG